MYIRYLDKNKDIILMVYLVNWIYVWLNMDLYVNNKCEI